MTDMKEQAKKIDDAYWKGRTNIPDIYTKGRVRFAAGLREVINQLQYDNAEWEAPDKHMIIDVKDILKLIEELEKL
jgi:hypothetical protein